MNKRLKLYRSREDRVLFGVCGGIAEYFDFDPAFVRIITTAIGLVSGIGILAYLLFLIFIPREPGELKEVNRKQKIKEMANEITEKAQNIASEIKQDNKDGHRRREIFGIILIGFGLLVLFWKSFPNHLIWLNWDIVWASIIIIIGLSFIFKKPKIK